MSFTSQYIDETHRILEALDTGVIENIVEELADIRGCGGRLFVIGVGGSAATASHAVNDFRKIARIEAYAPTDNVAELTARTNDQGWSSTFVEWLRVSRLNETDGVMVLSVGGGSETVSPNISQALRFSVRQGAGIYGIVGRDGGATALVADACLVIPPLFPEHVTPHTAGLASVVLHLLVSHPLLTES